METSITSVTNGAVPAQAPVQESIPELKEPLSPPPVAETKPEVCEKLSQDVTKLTTAA